MADEIAAGMNGIPRGVYEVIVMAIEQLGGEIRIQPLELVQRLAVAPQHMEVDGTDRAIVLRLGES